MTFVARLLTATAFLSLVAAPAFAQDVVPAAPVPNGPVEEDHNSLTIGAGGAFMPSYEGSNNYVLVPAGAVRGKVHDFNFFSRGTQLYVNLIPNQTGKGIDLELGAIGGVNLNRTGRLIDPQVRLLGHRKLAIEAGGFIGIGKTGLITSDYDNLTIRVGYVHDLSNIYRSYVITPQIQYSTPLSRKAFVAISASADYAGTGYSTAYFDVDAAGSLRSGLPVFTGRKGWKDFTVGGMVGHALTGDLLHGLGIYAIGNYTRMEGDFAASPVVRIAGSPNQWFGAIGIGYTF